MKTTVAIHFSRLYAVLNKGTCIFEPKSQLEAKAGVNVKVTDFSEFHKVESFNLSKIRFGRKNSQKCAQPEYFAIILPLKPFEVSCSRITHCSFKHFASQRRSTFSFFVEKSDYKPVVASHARSWTENEVETTIFERYSLCVAGISALIWNWAT